MVSSFSRWTVVFGRYAFLPVVFALALPSLSIEVANCDLKAANSSAVSWNLKSPNFIATSAYLSSASSQFGQENVKASRLHPLLVLAFIFAGATSHAISFPHISPAIHNDPHLLGDGLTTYCYDSEGRIVSAKKQGGRL